MAVRITTARRGERTVVRVDGRLLAEDVDVLLDAVDEADGSVLLDLTDLQSADPAGVTAILKLIGEGSQIVAASPYLKMRLQGRSGSSITGALEHEGDSADERSWRESEER